MPEDTHTEAFLRGDLSPTEDWSVSYQSWWDNQRGDPEDWHEELLDECEVIEGMGFTLPTTYTEVQP